MINSKPQYDFNPHSVDEFKDTLARPTTPKSAPGFHIWRARRENVKNKDYFSTGPSMNATGSNNSDRAFNGMGSAINWSRDVDRLIPYIKQVLGRTLEEAVTSGVCLEEKIAASVGRYSLHWPLPGAILQEITKFVVGVCKAVEHADKQTLEFNTAARTVLRPCMCFVVFHHGGEHYYYGKLPEEILGLRKTALFWIDQATKDFQSCGRKRKELRPQTKRVLRFICSEQNAGKTISFYELYSYVWRKDPPSFKSMVGSIEAEMSALNIFAMGPFQRSTYSDEAKVIRIRGGYEYKIKEETPNACCIVRPLSLPN